MDGLKKAPDWYTKTEIYQEELTLSRWGDELQWRSEFLHDYNERVEINGGHLDIQTTDLFVGKFKNNVINGYSEDKGWSSYQLAKGIKNPVRGIEEGAYVPDWQCLNNREGLILPLMINLSFDKETLLANFEKILDSGYPALNYVAGVGYKVLNNNSGPMKDSKNFLGKEAFKDSDAKIWNKGKVLVCLDFYIWKEMTRNHRKYYPSYGQKHVADFLSSKHIVFSSEKVSAMATLGRQLLNFSVISRIKASSLASKQQ